ncbi:chromosomal replication initiator protein DnaA [Candidatus Dojkabacteria bacterium]|nr:chromosomal replication initiator protein DnaA [Candidatus Dojkabacteria bacterium]
MKKILTQEVWKTTLAQIEIKLDSPAHYKTWFQPTELIEIKGKKAVIGVKNSYASDWLQKKHNNLIKETISHVAGTELEPTYVVSKKLANEDIPKISKEERQSTLFSVEKGENTDFSRILKDANLVSAFNFKSFITGPSNRLVHAAALAVCENPGKIYNPLFIYGKTGLGKTHIAQAIGQKILEKNQSKEILYIPSENFLNEMVKAIQTGKTRNFRNKYRYLDLLIIDDIQLISKWEQTQDELFNTFNALYNKNKQIILVSDRSPEKIHNLEARLKSRFQGGMVAQIEKPDFETRLAIVEYKTKMLGIDLDKNILSYIAKNSTNNVRQLEGNLQQIALFNQINSHKMTLGEVANLLGTDKKSKREKIKPREIIRHVSKEFQVTAKDILSRSRKADIAFARQVVMYILRKDLGYKLEDVAKNLNRKDHTTVMHAVDKVQSKIEVDKGFAEQIEVLRESIF